MFVKKNSSKKTYENPGKMNDLWKYNATLNQWTWIHGPYLQNQLGVYGSRGVGTTSTISGGRSYAAYWVDASGNFWVFGGNGYASSSFGIFFFFAFFCSEKFESEI
jgi:hypothetical protein